MADAKPINKRAKVTATAKNSATIGTIGAILIAIISKHGSEEWKSELILAVPFISVWIVACGHFIASSIKWCVIAYGPEEPTTVKLRRRAKKYKKKLLKELNCESTSEENKTKIRKFIDEVQLSDIETYDIK